MDIKNKFLDGIKHNLIGSILKHAVTFIISIFLSRLLGPAEFGLVGMSTIFITFTQGLSNMGLSSGLIREKDPTELQYNSVFYFNLTMALILSILAFSSAGILANFYREEKIKAIVQASSFLFIINSLNNVHSAIFYKQLEIKITRMGSVYAAILAGVFGISAAYYGLGVWSLIISSYTTTIAFTLYIWYKSTWRPRLIFSLVELKKLFPFGIKVFLVEYIDLIFSKLDVVLIGRFFSPTTLGFYFRALSLNEIVTKYTSQSLSGIFFPTIRKFDYDLDKIRQFLLKTFNVVSFISFALTGLLYLISKDLIFVLFGEKWLGSVEYFEILAFISLIFPLGFIFNGVLLGSNNPNMQLKVMIVKKMLLLAAILIGLNLGMKEYLYASLIASFLGMWYSINQLNLIFPKLQKELYVNFLMNFLPLIIGFFIVILSTKTLNKYIYINSYVELVIRSILFIFIFGIISKTFNLKGYIQIKHFLMNRGILMWFWE